MAECVRGTRSVKMLGALFASVLLGTGCVDVAAVHPVSGKQKVENCIAGYCLNGTMATESEVIASIGEGEIRRQNPVLGNIIHCYFDPIHETWLEFTFEGHNQSHRLLEIFASWTSLCEEKFRPKTQLRLAQTAGGIALGSTKADVLHVYGEPNRIDDLEAMERLNPQHKDTYLAARFGSPALVYDAYPASDELMHARFYLRGNKVQSILISISE